MKRVMTAILFGVAMLQAVTLTGTDFRVDLIVDKNICGVEFKGGSEGLQGKNAKWLKENADSRLLVIGKAGETWEEKSFQFTAKEDCEVDIHLLANPNGKILPWVAYDNIRIDGAAIKNGSFENLDKKGFPKNWGSYGKTKKYVLKKGSDAADGKKYIEVDHDNRAIQRIKCKKDQPATITFMVRDAKRTTERK